MLGSIDDAENEPVAVLIPMLPARVVDVAVHVVWNAVVTRTS
jgi:hypothetical protein